MAEDPSGQPAGSQSAGTRQITVRIADERDVEALARLRRAWTEERAGRPVSDAGFEAAFAQWAAEKDLCVNQTTFVLSLSVEAGGAVVVVSLWMTVVSCAAAGSGARQASDSARIADLMA